MGTRQKNQLVSGLLPVLVAECVFKHSGIHLAVRIGVHEGGLHAERGLGRVWYDDVVKVTLHHGWTQLLHTRVDFGAGVSCLGCVFLQVL